MHKFPYQWTLKDAQFTKDKGKVFSCFACGGGSTMGYKLAGFDVIGCNEIDPRMNKVYVENHHPKFNFLEPIQEFKLRKDLTSELYNLDILDGSPPCSSFSMAGNRDDDWGKEKKFREGQAMQVLDTLFFDFIDLAKELQPKVVIAENVKGLLTGEAISYVRRIYHEFDKAGYYCQHILLNSQYMGVPQQRERVFFLCLRKDLAEPFLYQYDMFTQRPRIEMVFKEEPIQISEFTDYKGKEVTSPVLRNLWENRQYGDKDQSAANMRLFGKPSNFGQSYVYQNQVCWTLTAKESSIIHFDKPRILSEHEVNCVSTFPQDYNYMEESPHYIAGMSVPPVMMAQVASRVYEQWLSKIPNTSEKKVCTESKVEMPKSNNEKIKGKVHCFFEQSGTFKNEFIKLGIPAEDYDIQNNFGETDHLDDLFKAIEDAYDGKPSQHPLKVITLCSGYDSQCLALNRLKTNYPDFDYELVAWAEYDPESKAPLERQPAVIAHNALFPQWADRNLGDITKIDWHSHDIECDLLFYSTPCQSISQAGLQHGFTEGSGTRSSIIWNVRDAVVALKPKYLCLENVSAMVSEKFIGMFNLWQSELERLGYCNFAQLMNAKDYGVAQNRDRIFLVSIRVDDEMHLPNYHFPKPFELTKKLKDYLEDKVDERYYLSDERVQGLIASTEKEQERGNGFAWHPTDGDGTAHALKTTEGSRKTDNFLFDDYE